MFSNYEKQILNEFFTSSDEKDTVYAAKDTLPGVVISYLMGRASRAPKTFREIFLDMWKEIWKELDVGEYRALFPLIESDDTHELNKIISSMVKKSEEFLNKWGSHESLKDTPHIAVFCDSLTILQTKVWEHEAVAEYQEKSTRYRPFSADNIELPNIENSALLEEIQTHLTGLVSLYDKIMNFTNKRDVARYVLPVGSRTAMGCMASIRSWERIINRMLAFPTKESTNLATVIAKHIGMVYSKFEVCFNAKVDDIFSYLQAITDEPVKHTQGQVADVSIFDGDILRVLGLIDIGAHRDLQRQRSIIQKLPDYRPIHGWDSLVIDTYLSKDESGELVASYNKSMLTSVTLYSQILKELKTERKEYYNGEAQYLSLLGHMTPFYYLCNLERWKYVYNLRTGNPSQSATTPETVHFSYATWCHKVQKYIDSIIF